jgi:phage terminase large subunit-like protein
MVDETKLEGRLCHGGLDLASVNDLTALCWDFPGPDGAHDALWRFWLPEARPRDLAKRTAGEAEVWVREGILTTTPGNVIDNDFIVRTILATRRSSRCRRRASTGGARPTWSAGSPTTA